MNAPTQAGLPALPLKDPKLFRTQCYIDGGWVDSVQTIPVRNPATGSVLGTVPKLGAGLRTGMVWALPTQPPST